jgi:GNAT superfamily N-acetyltransferase
VVIRPAKNTDSTSIAGLLPDLGYAAKAEDVARRLSRIVEWPDNSVFVAEVDDKLVGLCHVQGVPLVASDGYAEVQALVVSSSSQRKGVGTKLLMAAVTWSIHKGYTRVRLRSGLHRQEAHLFYEAQGFTRSKPSYAFELSIPAQ